MNWNATISDAREVILQDAIKRDLATARRTALFEILWEERFLTRDQLVSRVEFKLGKNCFGTSAWEDNFYRDMRIVKCAFKAANMQLLFSRNRQRPGYYLAGEPELSSDFRQLLDGSANDLDQRQIDVYRIMGVSQRVRQACSISNTARAVVAYRIGRENPGISLIDANRMALKRAYSR